MMNNYMTVEEQKRELDLIDLHLHEMGEESRSYRIYIVPRKQNTIKEVIETWSDESKMKPIEVKPYVRNQKVIDNLLEALKPYRTE